MGVDSPMAGDWKARWVQWRNRWLMRPDVQRLAWRTPGLRGIARRQAGALFDLVAGFTYSQLLLAGVQLGLFEGLKGGARSRAEIAGMIGLAPDSTERLLRGLAALGLVEALPGDRFALGELGVALVSNPGVGAMVAHHGLLYADLADPVGLLRARGGGALSQFWPYAENRADGASEAYSRLMAASQPMVAEAVLDAVDFGRHRHLLDVGGGEGAFLSAVSMRHPGLSLSLFDLPDVAARAAVRLNGRASCHGGRFPDDPLPTGADIISLVRILHDHDDAKVRALLQRVHAALPPGGTVLVAEPMAGVRGAEAMGDAYFGLYLLAMGSGRARTAAELSTMLRDSGFRNIRLLPTANPYAAQVLTAARDRTSVNND